MVLDRKRLFSADEKFGGGEAVPLKGEGYEVIQEVVSEGILSHQQVS